MLDGLDKFITEEQLKKATENMSFTIEGLRTYSISEPLYEEGAKLAGALARVVAGQLPLDSDEFIFFGRKVLKYLTIDKKVLAQDKTYFQKYKKDYYTCVFTTAGVFAELFQPGRITD
jgi:hypothetical protein